MGSTDSALISQLEHGGKKIIDLAKLMRIAEACAGEGDLHDFTPDQVLDFLLGRVEWETKVSPRPRPVERTNGASADSVDLKGGSTGPYSQPKAA